MAGEQQQANRLACVAMLRAVSTPDAALLRGPATGTLWAILLAHASGAIDVSLSAAGQVKVQLDEEQLNKLVGKVSGRCHCGFGTELRSAAPSVH